MSIFSSFSRTARDRDGSWTIYCVTCREPICKTVIPLGKMQCEMCRRIENGEVLTPEAVEQYRLSKQSVMGVTMVTMPPQPSDMANNVRAQGNGFLKAIGRILGHDVSESEKVVQDKTRGRLFDQVDLEQLGDDTSSLGTMESLNKLLEESEDQK